jgi:rsbT co-antagonist protein RsbR
MNAGAPFDFAFCPELLFIATEGGAWLRQSEALERMLGPAAPQGTPLADVVHPESQGAFAEAWARIKQSTEPSRFPCRIRDAQGSYRTLSCCARFSQETKAIYGSLREDTSELEAGAMQQRLMALQAFIDNLPVAFWIIDPQGVFTFNGGNGAATAGLKEGALVGLSMFDLYAGMPAAMVEVRRALAGEPRHWSGDAHDKSWENWALPFRDPAGEVVAVVGVSLDVTDVTRKEQELRDRIEMIEKQAKVIRDLSTPIIEVWDGVVTLPMVGIVDSTRAAELMSNLLDEIVRKKAHYAVLDLTGVEMVDTKTAQYLLEIVRAIRLLGAEGIITGIRPTVAQTMVALGLDLSSIITLADLRAGLKLCMQRMMAVNSRPSAEKAKARDSAGAPPSQRKPPRLKT